LHPNPNKALLVLLSFVPGAGHMYLGLMRRGVSFMAGFALSIAGAGAFSMISLLQAAFIILIPLTWFVAFFDLWRYPRMGPEEKALVRDDFLIPRSLQLPGGITMRKARIVAGILLILAGVYRLYRIFLYNFIYDYLHSERVIYFFERMPTLLGGVAVIAVGLLLIFWKSRQLKREAGGYEK